MGEFTGILNKHFSEKLPIILKTVLFIISGWKLVPFMIT